MRLPFAQVLVTFAEPARLPAVDPSVLAGDPRMREIDHVVGISDREFYPKEVMIAATNNFQSTLPTLWDAIAGRGCSRGGDPVAGRRQRPHRRPVRRRLAIPSAAAGAALGRRVIPASRSATAYSHLIANAAAVAAWADWHRPGHDRTAAEQDITGATTEATHSRQQARLADIVHVLNVAATTPVDPQPTTRGEPTGRTTAPHARRRTLAPPALRARPHPDPPRPDRPRDGQRRPSRRRPPADLPPPEAHTAGISCAAPVSHHSAPDPA